jgi:hypothetical protein
VAAGRGACFRERRGSSLDSRGIGAGKHVPTEVESFGPLGLVAQRDAGDAVEEGFLLDASTVSEDERGPRLEILHLEISDRLEQAKALERNRVAIRETARAGVKRQDERQPACHPREPGEDRAKPFGIVGVFCAMQRQQRVGRRAREPCARARACGCGGEQALCFQHDVANHVDAAGDSLGC